MSTTQLVGVITLIGTILVAGIALGRSQQQITDLERRINMLERIGLYLHGDIHVPGGQ